eukprot:scaffold46475_cov24-Tisochrysis_lutea.AAC.1
MLGLQKGGPGRPHVPLVESATGEPVLPTPQTEKATGGPILQEGHRASYSAHLHIQHLAKPAEGRLVGGYLQALVNCFRPEDV